MLVLSRHCGESILIDGDIKVTITNISRSSVRIGIEAPEHIGILREELCKKSCDLLGQSHAPEKTGILSETEL